jgi:hypothetical protein
MAQCGALPDHRKKRSRKSADGFVRHPATRRSCAESITCCTIFGLAWFGATFLLLALFLATACLMVPPKYMGDSAGTKLSAMTRAALVGGDRKSRLRLNSGDRGLG